MEVITHCTLCPRRCGVNRSRQPGRCGGGSRPTVARAALHPWEEPCLSGSRGSGTVFFAGCPLGCSFCQNGAISRAAPAVKVKETDGAGLAEIFLSLQARGAHNINLVTATHYAPWVARAVPLARAKGLALPVVWNSGGYEVLDTLELLRPHVDVWLLDVKFHDSALSARLANAPDYFEHAAAAAAWACAAAGPPVLGDEGLLRRGVILRLLVLPGSHRDAIALLEWMAAALPPGGFLLSLMSQYTPPEGVALRPPMDRRVAAYEYRKVLDAAHRLGLELGYTQQRASASSTYIPPFGWEE